MTRPANITPAVPSPMPRIFTLPGAMPALQTSAITPIACATTWASWSWNSQLMSRQPPEHRRLATGRAGHRPPGRCRSRFASSSVCHSHIEHARRYVVPVGDLPLVPLDEARGPVLRDHDRERVVHEVAQPVDRAVAGPIALDRLAHLRRALGVERARDPAHRRQIASDLRAEPEQLEPLVEHNGTVHRREPRDLVRQLEEGLVDLRDVAVCAAYVVLPAHRATLRVPRLRGGERVDQGDEERAESPARLLGYEAVFAQDPAAELLDRALTLRRQEEDRAPVVAVAHESDDAPHGVLHDEARHVRIELRPRRRRAVARLVMQRAQLVAPPRECRR